MNVSCLNGVIEEETGILGYIGSCQNIEFSHCTASCDAAWKYMLHEGYLNNRWFLCTFEEDEYSSMCGIGE